jgi:hypothetical protein
MGNFKKKQISNKKFSAVALAFPVGSGKVKLGQSSAQPRRKAGVPADLKMCTEPANFGLRATASYYQDIGGLFMPGL